MLPVIENIKKDLSGLGITCTIFLNEADDYVKISLDEEGANRFNLSYVYEGKRTEVFQLFYEDIDLHITREVEKMVDKTKQAFDVITSRGNIKVIEVDGKRFAGRILDIYTELKKQFFVDNELTPVLN